MNMNLNMSFEEGMKVVNALHECATKYGWVVDECSIMEEYTAAVDAALTAMGISVNIAREPEPEAEDEDENKYCDSAADCCFCNSDNEEWHEDAEDGYFNADDDEEDDDDSTVYSLTAKGEFVLRYMNAGHTFKEACKIADILFGNGE